MATRRQRRIIKTAARRYGISPRILWGVYGTESGFGHNQGPSSAGAVGPFQFMPGTARGLHINPYNFKQAAFGAAKYLSEYKGRGLSGMLSAYNAGPGGAIQPGYVHTVLDQSKSWGPVKGGVHGGSQHPMVTGTTTTTTSSPSVGQVDVTSLLSSLARPAPVASSLPALPAFAAKPVTAGAPVQADSSPQPKADLSSMLAAASSLQGASLPGVKSTTTVNGQGGVKGSGTPNVHVKGLAKFDGKPVAAWIAPALKYARAHGWKGSVNSGYRSYAQQVQIYNSGVRPAAKPGTSNHEFKAFPGGAVDVTDAAQLSAILRRSKWKNVLVWAGGKDPVHFSHPHNGSY